MQQHSIGYIIGFAATICVVCALFVAGSAVSLKERQQRNIVVDRQKNVLAVSGLMRVDESLDAAEIQRRFEKSIRPKIVKLATGEWDESVDTATFDQRKAAKDPATSVPAPRNPAKVMRLPNDALVYEVVDEKGVIQTLILPVQGTGLWSILYGYLALAPDLNTIRGITFYEQGETAGLGGEVDNPRWKAKWIGRKAFDESGKPVIHVKKGVAGPPETDPYQVDGLSGASLTSRGVTNLVQFWLGDHGFGPFIEKFRVHGAENPAAATQRGS